MAIFGHLPDEITCYVLESLTFNDFRSLCLVNHQLHRVAIPYLYQTIEWRWSELELFQGPASPILLFLRSILHQPELSKFVHNLFLLGEDERAHPADRPATTISLDLHVESIRRTDVSYAAEWIERLRDGSIDVCVALLLSLVPNLRRLHLDPGFTRENYLLGQVLQSALYHPLNDRLPRWPSLHGVSFILQDENGHRVLFARDANPLPFFYLGGVKRLNLSILNGPVGLPEWRTHAPDPSTLSNLTLHLVRETFLERILSVTTGLKQFTWQWSYDYGRYDPFNTDIALLDRVDAALSHVRGTLTDLKISALYEFGDRDIYSRPMTIHGSLRGVRKFKELKRFEAPVAFLMGFELDLTRGLEESIPASLEHLLIRDDLNYTQDYCWDEDDEWILLIDRFLETSSTHAPRIRRISCVHEDEYYRTRSIELIRQVEEACSQKRIEFEIVPSDGPF